MIDSILGKKLGMTQVFDEKGAVIPVTVIQAGPVRVTQVRTKEKDGYEAVQIGFEESSRLKKPQVGHQKDLIRTEENGKYQKQFGLKFLREIRTSTVAFTIALSKETAISSTPSSATTTSPWVWPTR